MTAVDLPRKLSALLRIAVEDAQKIEETPGYVLEMGAWAEKTEAGVCMVCMAGAVMVSRLGIDLTNSFDGAIFMPSDCATNRPQLRAIDSLRCLDIEAAARIIGADRERARAVEQEIGPLRIRCYGGGLDRLPWSDYLAIADCLEGAEL